MPPPGEVGGNGGSGGADGGSVVRGEVADFFAGAFLVADFFAGAFLVADFFAGAFLVADFFAGAFWVADFFAGAFFAVAFLAAGRRAAGADADAARGREPLVTQARSAASWSCATTWSVSGL